MIGDIHKYCHLLLQEVESPHFDSCDDCYFHLSEDPWCGRPADFPNCSYTYREDDSIDIIFVNVGEYD